MITLMIKGVLCLMASFLLIATTTIEEICYGFRQLHVPKILTSLMLLTYRYVSLLLEEVDIMTTAYHLRAPGQKGIHYKAWGSFLGELLIRTMDRATTIYESMELRGYHGEFYYVTKEYPVKKSIIYSVIWLIIFFVFLIKDEICINNQQKEEINIIERAVRSFRTALFCLRVGG